jgi:hypothetical protein
MRTARLLRWGIGTVAGLVALAEVGGCGVGSSGISVVGVNPGSGAAGSNAVAVVTTRSTSTALTAAPNAAPAVVADKTISTSQNANVNPNEACAAADLSLQVFESSRATPSSSHARNPVVPIAPGLGALHGTRAQQLTLVFTNVSHAACTMRGYPSVDFLRSGIHGPLSAPDSFLRATKVTDVRLSPGGAAKSLISFTTNSTANSRGSRCDEVVAVRVYAPGSVNALISGARDETNHNIPHFYVCGHKVVVRAVQPK